MVLATHEFVLVICAFFFSKIMPLLPRSELIV